MCSSVSRVVYLSPGWRRDCFRFHKTHRKRTPPLFIYTPSGKTSDVGARMPNECSICTQPNRDEINKVMQGKASARAVSRDFGVSKSAADRHRRNCLPGIKARARELRAVKRDLPMLPQQDDPFIERI